MNEKVKTRKGRIYLFLAKFCSKRASFGRWLLDKLLGSFLVSLLIIYDSFFGLKLTQSPFQVVYFLVAFLSIVSYILSLVLIPSQKQQVSES